MRTVRESNREKRCSYVFLIDFLFFESGRLELRAVMMPCFEAIQNRSPITKLGMFELLKEQFRRSDSKNNLSLSPRAGKASPNPSDAKRENREKTFDFSRAGLAIVHKQLRDDLIKAVCSPLASQSQ